jgi:hypothetical protein
MGGREQMFPARGVPGCHRVVGKGAHVANSPKGFRPWRGSILTLVVFHAQVLVPIIDLVSASEVV